MWLENQKFVSDEVGFATLTKEEINIQVEEIMKELVEIRTRRERRIIINYLTQVVSKVAVIRWWLTLWA